MNGLDLLLIIMLLLIIYHKRDKIEKYLRCQTVQLTEYFINISNLMTTNMDNVSPSNSDIDTINSDELDIKIKEKLSIVYNKLVDGTSRSDEEIRKITKDELNTIEGFEYEIDNTLTISEIEKTHTFSYFYTNNGTMYKYIININILGGDKISITYENISKNKFYYIRPEGYLPFKYTI
jgi:hypothetical protein